MRILRTLAFGSAFIVGAATAVQATAATYIISGDALFANEADAALFGFAGSRQGSFEVSFSFDSSLTTGQAGRYKSWGDYSETLYRSSPMFWTFGNKSWTSDSPSIWIYDFDGAEYAGDPIVTDAIWFVDIPKLDLGDGAYVDSFHFVFEADSTFLTDGDAGAMDAFVGATNGAGEIDIGKPYGENPVFFNVSLFKVAPAVPEPATWLTMIMGFGLSGLAVRRRRIGVSS